MLGGTAVHFEMLVETTIELINNMIEILAYTSLTALKWTVLAIMIENVHNTRTCMFLHIILWKNLHNNSCKVMNIFHDSQVTQIGVC